MEFVQKIRQFSSKFHMLKPQTGVLVGLSGGADSVALLEVLCQLREELSLQLFAVHIHHGLRFTADRDAAFCEALCKEKNVPIALEYVDVRSLAKDGALSVEEAGRKARYDVLERYRSLQHLDVIAVAHHKNDQAETMLFQLFRGSSLRGLTGIPYKRGHIIRPLMTVTREEIEVFLEDMHLSYMTDETNASDAYARNKIRHHILPVAQEISHHAVEHMAHTATQLLEVQDFLDAESNRFFAKYVVREKEEIIIPVNVLKEQHIALQKSVIMQAIDGVLESRRDITERHIESIVALLDRGGEKTLSLPKGLRVTKRYDSLHVSKDFTFNGEIKKEEVIVVEPGMQYVLPNGCVLEASFLTKENFKNIPKSDCIKWFDYDKITHTLVVRTRRAGDYLTIDEKESKKSLQDYLVNEKIPKSKRDDLWLLADDNHIVWVLGKRISARYKVSEQTEKILQISIGEAKDERTN